METLVVVCMVAITIMAVAKTLGWRFNAVDREETRRLFMIQEGLVKKLTESLGHQKAKNLQYSEQLHEASHKLAGIRTILRGCQEPQKEDKLDIRELFYGEDIEGDLKAFIDGLNEENRQKDGHECHHKT
jgi:hypothetical protein